MDVMLLKAIRTVISIDNSPERLKVFEEVVQKNFIIRLVYRVHYVFRNSFLGSLMVAVYGLKSFLVPVLPKKQGSIIFAVATFPNEHRQIDYVGTCVGEEYIGQISLSKINLFSFATLVLFFSALRNFRSFQQYLRVIARYNAHYSFMPACRIASTIGFYLRFRMLLEQNPPRAVLVASDYSPDALGLIYSARQLGIPRIHVPHGHRVALSWIPKLDFELSILDGEASLDTYKAIGKIGGKVVFKGVEGFFRPMQLNNLHEAGMTIGVFLSGTFLNTDVLLALLSGLHKQFQPQKIIVRLHPAKITTPNLPPSIINDKLVEITQSSPLQDDIAQCNLVISGNSSVHLQLLKYGVPTIRLKGLDDMPEDYNGFVAGRIVMLYTDVAYIKLEELKQFYSGNWVDRFSYYDAMYGRQPEESEKIVREAVLALVQNKG